MNINIKNSHLHQQSQQCFRQCFTTGDFYNYDHVTNFIFRRFFPYYVYNLVAGLDDEGKGAVFSYDPVGSYDRDEMKCAGSAASLIQPFLDNQIGRQHIQVRKMNVFRIH